MIMELLEIMRVLGKDVKGIQIKVKEIHETVVKGAPANENLVSAAQNVVDVMNGHGEWGDLKEAIRHLGAVLIGRE